MKLLYVENHAVFAQTAIAQFLSGHEVQVTPSLAGARAALLAGRFDALLVDFDLDDGKGAELVAELRAAGQAVPIIAVSATKEGNDALLAAGASLAVSKAAFPQLPSALGRLSARA